MNEHVDAELVPIKNGWAAVDRQHRWAVFAETRADAQVRYEEAEAKHEELRRRETATTPPDAGVGPSATREAHR